MLLLTFSTMAIMALSKKPTPAVSVASAVKLDEYKGVSIVSPTAKVSFGKDADVGLYYNEKGKLKVKGELVVKGQSVDAKLKSLTELVKALKATVDKQAATIVKMQKKIASIDAVVPAIKCSSKLGGAFTKDGRQWVKVAKIDNNRNHITTGSNTNKLSDAEINKLRSKGTGKLWLQCGTTTVFLDEKAKPFNALASGKSMIRECSAKADGPFKEAAPKHGAHRSIDCWDMGIKVMYQHLGVNGCWNVKGNGKTGALYVDCSAPPKCSNKLGGSVLRDGKHWLKVAKIDNNRNHITTGSNSNKLSDAEINKLRSKGTGKLWLQCGDTTVFLDEKAKPFNALASGKSMIRKCSAKADGPFKEAAPKHSAHRSIDCWDMGIKVMYQHLGVNGCWNVKGNGKTGALYVECPAS